MKVGKRMGCSKKEMVEQGERYEKRQVFPL